MPTLRAMPAPASLDHGNARQFFDLAAEAAAPAPGIGAGTEGNGSLVVSGEGQGVVIPGGGTKYFPCAWVCIHMLRHLGCKLPIELWHLGEKEMTPQMRGLVEPLGVTCVDALQLRKERPARILNGWELKPYAMLHSRFREIVMLDADNVPLVTPEALLQWPQYREHGAVFWPDMGRLGPERSIWPLTGVAYRSEPEFETGQMVVDKGRCRGALALTMWMNEHSDFWYRHVHGDKETFHFAWRKLGMPYAMPGRLPHGMPRVMYQHDFQGRLALQHRNGCKWQVDGGNPKLPGFVHEDLCLRFLDRLRRAWDRPGRPFDAKAADDGKREAAKRLCGTRWTYRRVGHDERPMGFAMDGSVQEGAAGCERHWNLVRTGQRLHLEISGRDGVTCVLSPSAATGGWAGKWIIHEGMPIELAPITPHGSTGSKPETGPGPDGGIPSEEVPGAILGGAAMVACADLFVVGNPGVAPAVGVEAGPEASSRVPILGAVPPAPSVGAAWPEGRFGNLHWRGVPGADLDRIAQDIDTSLLDARSPEEVWRRFVPSDRALAMLGAADRPMRILDFGCGLGRNMEGIVGRFPRASVVGYDSGPMVLRAQAWLPPHPRCALACDWGLLREERFDAVLAVWVFQHIGEAELREYLRDLKAMAPRLVVEGRRVNDDGHNTWRTLLEHFEIEAVGGADPGPPFEPEGDPDGHDRVVLRPRRG